MRPNRYPIPTVAPSPLFVCAEIKTFGHFS
jgi:hypothetical protein